MLRKRGSVGDQITGLFFLALLLLVVGGAALWVGLVTL